MKSFISKGKKPLSKWGRIAENTWFEGTVPEGYNLCICPSDGYIVIDVDRHDGKEDGFKFALYSPSIEAIAHEETFSFISSQVANIFRSMVDLSLSPEQLADGFLGMGYHLFYWIQITIVFGFLVLQRLCVLRHCLPHSKIKNRCLV